MILVTDFILTTPMTISLCERHDTKLKGCLCKAMSENYGKVFIEITSY